MNDLTDHVADSCIEVKSCKHQGVCIAMSKVKIYTNTNKEKFWMPWEHHVVKQVIVA